ncbi:VOC family protein [Isosphaeraceae bacterium EP7]
MTIKNVLASVAVKDLSVASEWYEKLFGRPADSRPMGEVAEWKSECGGWLQVYQLPERAGSGSFTLAVRSVEEAVAHLDAMGVDTGTRTSGAKVKTVMVTDPDGNHIAFAETSDPSMAQ